MHYTHSILPLISLSLALVLGPRCGCGGQLEEKKPPVMQINGHEPTLHERVCIISEKAAKDPEVQKQVDRILKEAKKILAKPMVYRAFSMNELKSIEQLGDKGDKRSSRIDRRSIAVEKVSPKKAELFALAMSDGVTAQCLYDELPLFAAAYLLTKDHAYLDRIIAQLKEAVTWTPLQRPGWTLYTPENELPPGGDDGSWIPTGFGLVGLSRTLQILPEGSLPAEVEKQVREFMGQELERVRSDWENKVPWYVRHNACASNQWVIPISGVIVASVTLGKETHPEAYELGVRSLQQTLSRLGTDGADSEGPGYAMGMTAPFLYQAARSTKDAGDNRLAGHGFLQNFPKWLAQAFQPAKTLVNCFDCTPGARDNYWVWTTAITQNAVLSGDPHLFWILRNQIKTSSNNIYDLLALSFPSDMEKEPPLWGCFQRAHYLVWRDSWSDNASGVWIRGGDIHDGHDHGDRGHVNYIANGKIVLMDVGTSRYEDPKQREEYQSIKGHNVLQVGDNIFPTKCPAPIHVNSINGDGGDVTVEAGAGYPHISKWTRRVVWDKVRMEVTDTVSLTSAQPILFRWHLASEETLQIKSKNVSEAEILLPAGNITFADAPVGTTVSMGTPEVSARINSSAPISCSQEKHLDHALYGRSYSHEHTTLIVRSNQPVSEITIHTSFESPKQP